MKVFFAANVWGKHYIDIFCNMTLPMHFSPSNIPKIAKDSKRNKYLIITDKKDLDYFIKKPIIIFLKKKYNIVFYTININKRTNKYNLISSLQSLSINLAKKEDFDYFFPFYADVLCSDGTLYNSFEKMKNGKKAVVSLGPQTILENMIKKIKSKEFCYDKYSIKINSQKLVELTFENLHPFHAPSFWEEKKFTTTPSMIFFRVDKNNVIAHGFHLHPVCFKLPNELNLYKEFYGTLDENYLTLLFESIEKIHISQDSEEVFMCSLESLSFGDARQASTSGNPSITKVSRYAERHTYLLHRQFIKYPIRLRSNLKLSKNFLSIEKKAREVVNAVLLRSSCPDSTIKYDDHISYLNRKYHIQELKKMQQFYLSYNVGYVMIVIYIFQCIISFIPYFLLTRFLKIFQIKNSKNESLIKIISENLKKKGNKYLIIIFKILLWTPFKIHETSEVSDRMSLRQLLNYLKMCFKYRIKP